MDYYMYRSFGAGSKLLWMTEAEIIRKSNNTEIFLCSVEKMVTKISVVSLSDPKLPKAITNWYTAKFSR